MSRNIFADSYIMKLFDNHCHLEELDRLKVLEKELKVAGDAGIEGWFSSALSREEYKWHQQNKIPGMIWCAGIHPFYEKSKESDLGYLNELCASGEIAAIGEVGLDSRNPNENRQKKILLLQLEMARDYQLPVVLHVVKKYYEMFKLLKMNFPKIRGWLHGFNGSMEVMKTFCSFDLGFSLNIRLPRQEVVKAIVKRGVWQIETDAPYARPSNCFENYNSLANLIAVKKEIENITGKKLWK